VIETPTGPRRHDRHDAGGRAQVDPELRGGNEMIDAGAVWVQLVIMLGVIALVAITIGASGVYLQRRRRR